MTTVAVAFQERIERVRTAAFSDARVIPALALLTAILAAFTWGTWGDLDSDTGYDIAASARIVDGELPYRDFVYPTPETPISLLPHLRRPIDGRPEAPAERPPRPVPASPTRISK